MSRKIEGSKLKKVGPDDPTFTFASSWIFTVSFFAVLLNSTILVAASYPSP